jgi:hypothetical protein
MELRKQKRSQLEKAFQEIKAYPEHHLLNEYTKLISAQDAQALLDVCGDVSELSPTEADNLAQEFLGFFLTREAIDPKQFTKGVSQIFQSCNSIFVKRVCNPVTGLPAKEKWLPSLAAIKEALDVELVERRKIEFKAEWTLAEIERRAEKKKRDDEYKNVDFEKRRQDVERILGYAIQTIEPEKYKEPSRKTTREEMIADLG